MRILAIVSLVIFILPSLAEAQDPSAEVFGGYSYFRATEDDGANLNGWNASVAANANSWIGVVMDVSGHYGNRSALVQGPAGQLASVDADAKLHNFLVGPRVSLRALPMVTPFVHGLFGVSWAKVNGSATFGATTVELSETENAFALGFGGGLDATLLGGVALRLVQVDYIQTQFGDGTQDNVRVSFGIVARFGSQ
ncbi:MAG TPA: hypothetical protein VIC04_02135 [Terriglobia bacterium]